LESFARAANVNATSTTAAGTAMAILQAVVASWDEPLEDDGTVVVVCVV